MNFWKKKNKKRKEPTDSSPFPYPWRVHIVFNECIMAGGFALISGEFSAGQVGKVEIIICLCSWLIPHIFDTGFPPRSPLSRRHLSG